MKKMMIIMAAVITAALQIAVPAYAAEREEIPVESMGDGLEGSIIDVADLASSEENNCQLTITGKLPEHFDANIYVHLKNDDNGNIYQYTLYAVNGHSQRGYIPDGDYHMMEASVYGDVNNMFPFILAEDFSIKKGEVKTIELILENEQNAQDVISNRTKDKDKQNETNKEIAKNLIGHFTESDFYVKFNRAGFGQMAITGSPSSEMSVFVKVTKPGVPGDMTVDISLDDGLSYFQKDVEVPYSGLVELKGTGLKLVFEVPKDDDTSQVMGRFEEGDTFRAVIHDPKSGVDYTGKNKGKVKLELVDVDPDVSIYDQMVRYEIPQIVVKVIKGGRAGDAVIRYSLDGKTFSDEMIVPFSGGWTIRDTTLSISFYALTGDLVFETGDSYIATPYKESNMKIWISVVVVMILFITAALAIYHFFKKQIVPQETYVIHEYKPIRERKN